MKSSAEIQQIQQQLKAKGVKYCIGAYVDIHGVPKGKVVPIDHLPQMAAGSELYTGYALDGLGQKPNDNEIASVPDLDHIIQLPWQPEVAWMPADNTLYGQPYPLNTRVALKNQLAKAAEMGFGLNLGIEAELFVLKQNEDGSLSVPNPDDRLTKPCYDARGFLHQFSWLDKMATTINDLGWDLYSFDHEDANGQFEFDFMYADAVTSCDRYTFLRLWPRSTPSRRD
jgi:glutamine synthetase